MKNFTKSFLIIFSIFTSSFYAQKSNSEPFTFIFATDIHLQHERGAVQGFKKAIEEINKINPDFVITGGDLIMDALGVDYDRADSLYNLYIETAKLIDAHVYNTMGNHEVFGLYDTSNVLRTHPEFGENIFEKRIGARYYSFIHKGVKFMILDSIEERPEGNRYHGKIDKVQIEWIKNELNNTWENTPIILSTHIPFITIISQLRGGSLKENSPGLVIENSKEVLDLFEKHNLKLVLQGHLHFYEDINILNKTHFVTGGAISARWWTGPNDGLEEGFVIVNVNGDDITAEYYDYGWEVGKNISKD
jgi:Icc-related predicted phosphoesterase